MTEAEDFRVLIRVEKFWILGSYPVKTIEEEQVRAVANYVAGKESTADISAIYSGRKEELRIAGILEAEDEEVVNAIAAKVFTEALDHAGVECDEVEWKIVSWVDDIR